MKDPFPMGQLAEERPTSPPSLQTDSAEDIVRELADLPDFSFGTKVLDDLDALIVRARIWRAKHPKVK